jgi:hypothetical protein
MVAVEGVVAEGVGSHWGLGSEPEELSVSAFKDTIHVPGRLVELIDTVGVVRHETARRHVHVQRINGRQSKAHRERDKLIAVRRVLCVRKDDQTNGTSETCRDAA